MVLLLIDLDDWLINLVSRLDIHTPYPSAASFFARSDTHRPESSFSDLYNQDFVLAARRVGHHQLARLDTSPYQRELLACGLDHWARGECPDRRMEQGMGYSTAIGTVLMDKLAGVCKRNEERFTGVRTDLGKVEEELGKACDWSTRVQEQVDALEMNVWRLEESRRAMREEMRDLTNGMYLLVELNQRLMGDLCQLRASQIHGRSNPIVINEPDDDMLDLAPVHVLPPIQHQLVLIDELSGSVEDSEEGERVEELESSEDEEEVWEIPQEEFEATARSSSLEL